MAPVDDYGDARAFTRVFTDKSPKDLRLIANKLIDRKIAAVLLASVEDRTFLVFARREDECGNMNALVKETLANLGSGSGGGSKHFAQGSTAVTDVGILESTLLATAKKLSEIDT